MQSLNTMASESLQNISKSCLHDRQHFVAMDDESRLYTVNSGVTQGSTLGALPILIYINGLINFTPVRPQLFAYDTSLCFTFLEFKNLQEIINSDFKTVSEWIAANTLRFNAKNSSFFSLDYTAKQSWAFKKHIVKRKRKFCNQNFLTLKRKRKFCNQNFLTLKRKCKFRNQNFLTL